MKNIWRGLLLAWFVACLLNIAGCGGGGGNAKPSRPPKTAECFDASTVCCPQEEYKVGNGEITICAKPDTNVVWDGHNLYLEDK